MFKFDTAVDQVVKSAKVATAFVQHEKTRQDLEALVDLQAEYAKTFYKSAEDLANLQLKFFKDSNFSKFFKV